MPIGWAIAIVFLWLAVIALAVVVLGLLRQLMPLLERAVASTTEFAISAQGPLVGHQLPYFVARDAEGKAIEQQQFRGRPSLLLFLSAGCGPCKWLAEELGQADLGELADQLIIIAGPDAPEALGIPAGLRILTESANEVSGALAIRGTPFAVAVDPSGIVRASSVPNTVKDLDSLSSVLA
jgi:methylamine dehydrogenase accessory protein MauD